MKAALAAVGNAEKAAEEIGRLPSEDDVGIGDKGEVDRVKAIVDGLSENEKAMLGRDAVGKIDALTEKIRKLAEGSGKDDSPKTGDSVDPSLWIALLLISGGVLTCTAVGGKKKKRSVK